MRSRLWITCERFGRSVATHDLAHTLAHPLAASRTGIFAVGDVRCGSLKRFASAVGDGAVVVASVHQALADR